MEAIAALPDAFERRARAIAEALFASATDPADPARVDWVVRDFADFVARIAPRSRFIFVLCTWVCTWFAPLFVWRFGPLESLDLELRTRALERMERGPFGPAVLGPKILLCTIWFEHPEIREATCLR